MEQYEEEEKIKKQEELEAFRIEKAKQGIYIKQNPKKYNLIQIWLHSFVGIILGLFTQKKETIFPKQLSQEIDELEQEVEQIQNLEQIQVCYQKVEQKEMIMKQTLEKQNFKVTPDDKKMVNQSFEKIEMMKKRIIQKDSDIKKKTSKSPVVSESLVKSISEKGIEQKQDPFITLPKEENLTHVNQSVVFKNSQKDYQHYVIESNKKIKKQSEKLKKKKEKIEKATTPQELYYIESEILWIQKQLEALEKEYQEISSQKEFQYLKNQVSYYKIDKNDLLKNDQSIKRLINECQSQIDEIEKKAKQKGQNQDIKEKDKKEEPKKEPRKIKNKEYYLDVDDFTNLKTHIMEDLKQQVMELNSIQFMTPQTGLFLKIKKFISNTMISIMPVYFFKNKLAGILTSTIVAHNRIRSMRQIVNQEQMVYETGEKLFTQIESKQDCLQAIQMHLNGSLTELEQLKSDFILKYQELYPVETENIILQMNQLEQQLIEKSMSLQLQQRKMVQMKHKYQKIIKKQS